MKYAGEYNGNLGYSGDTGNPDSTAGTGVGAGWVGAVLQTGASVYNQERTNRANRKMAEYQYSKDLEMWNRGNMYMSPMEQMKRLKEAGLNPNMIYGSGSGATGQMAQLPKYQAPQQSYNLDIPVMMVPQMINAFQDMKIKQQNYDNLRIQNKLLIENARTKELAANYLEDTYGSRVDQQTHKENAQLFDTQQKDIKARIAWYLYTGGQTDTLPIDQNKGLQGHQLSIAEAKAREAQFLPQRIQSQINAVDTATKLKQLEVDWYESKLIAGFGGKIAGALGSFFKGARKGQGAHAPKKKVTKPPDFFQQKRQQSYEDFLRQLKSR